MKEIRCEKCDKTFKNQDALEMHNKSKHYKKSQVSKKTILIGIVAIVIIGLVMFFFISKDRGNNPSAESVQKVTVSFAGNYAPNTIDVKAGEPVEITLDNSVQGCYRSFNIPLLGVSKISSSPSDTIRFTPKTPGIYRYQCGMNMGYGTIIVS